MGIGEVSNEQCFTTLTGPVQSVVGELLSTVAAGLWEPFPSRESSMELRKPTAVLREHV